MSAPVADRAREADQFAETVDAAVRRFPAPEVWTPGAAVSDADPQLDAALAAAGWDDLGEDPALVAFVAPAAAALGRGFASLRPVDRLLGGSLRHRGLARYAVSGERLVTPRAGRLEISTAERLSPVPYTDPLGVASVSEARALDTVEGPTAGTRMCAWIAGSVGYLAGLCEEALRLALDHTRSRVAFGRPLAALEQVQQTLADAATITEGLRLLTRDEPGADELAYAGAAAIEALAGCQQLTGALGFTLEFPLQRAYRRVRASHVWSEAVLDAWEGAAP